MLEYGSADPLSLCSISDTAVSQSERFRLACHLSERSSLIALPPCSVSVVDTATNTVIGSALKEWTDGKYLENDFSNTCPSYPPLDEVSFNVTVPALGNKCTEVRLSSFRRLSVCTR